ncbi:amino acid ABC transporter permease [Clostridium vincentii]|uniref:Arginine transport system permease protein ArtQ n=1 Tax=Clostridium vincentii TaxID=52704 RepID=A0A2T0BED7_9CLOT|nr:amino acid ABC transporter permease [Clostridium vincentii]PRR82229.1 Arginine transport system permease protein ArtQ [Clostridium vincentii]
MSTSLELMPQLLEGLIMTLKVFVFTLVVSIPLGIIVSLGRISKVKIIKTITGIYVLVMRGTPLLLQIIFIFFGLPIIGVNIENRFLAAVVAFVLNYAAYFAEIFRGGILSIDKGQYEGAAVLGLSSRDTFLRIILPQAFKRILPPVANEIITLVKDTSLIYAVGLDELLKAGKIAANKLSSLLPLVLVGIIYLLLIAIFTKVLSKIEEKYNYYE